MKRLRLVFTVILILLMGSGLLISTVHAEDPGFSKRIVVFRGDVPHRQMVQCAHEWEHLGVSIVMELPLINGLVIRAPVSISSAELAADSRVLSVEGNQKLKLKRAVTGQAVSATADGGAADGGAADGGAADGGAADGGAADGGAADGGAADGGAADGGAADGGAADGGAADGGAADGGAADGGAADGGAAEGGAADGGAADGGAADGGAADGGAADGGAGAGATVLPPAWSFIQPVSTPPEGHRPWGILKLLDQLDDVTAFTDLFDLYDVPAVVRVASWRLPKEKVRVAVLDTGIQYNHPNLACPVKGGIDLVHMIPDRLPMDDNGHGTHIAGTLCAQLFGGDFGLVPEVELYVVKILDEYAAGDLFTIVMALQWAVERDIDIVNMSIGYREDSPAIRLAVQEASKAGLIMIAAAGNHSTWDAPAISAAADGGAADGGAADGGAADGGAADGGAADGGAADGGAADGGAADGGAADGGAADGGAADGGAADGGAADGGAADGGAADGGAAEGGAADGGDSGIGWYSVMFPARYPEVIAVGASTPYGELASLSNSGDKLDLIAPGTDVVSTNLGGGFGVCSGTSMAAPHVSGTVAMMLALDPQLSSVEVKRILKETALGPEDAGELNLVGALEKVWDNAVFQGKNRFLKRWLHKLQRRMYREEVKAKLHGAGIKYKKKHKEEE